MKETEKAWLAGIIDGEGHIEIKKYKQQGCKSHVYKLAIRISMCSEKTIEYIKQTTNLGTNYNVNRLTKSGRRVFEWYAGSNNALNILRQTLPYLITKQDQAQLGIKFQANRKRLGKGSLSDKERQFQEDCFQFIRELRK